MLFRSPDGRDPLHDPENYFAFVTGTGDWARHEITAQVPPDASLVVFGVFLNGRGQIELRNPQLDPNPASQEAQTVIYGCGRPSCPISLARRPVAGQVHAARPSCTTADSGWECG